jgi:ATP10 protein
MGALATRRFLLGRAIVLWLALAGSLCEAQVMPSTEGETLSGHRLVLAQAVRGHASILIASFSRDAGPLADQWAKAARADAALAAATVYQAAMLGRAPGPIRAMVKSGLRKQTPAAVQDAFVVLTQDEPMWRSYFGVAEDKDPYVVLIDAGGQIRWHGHGSAAYLEPLLKDALK